MKKVLVVDDEISVRKTVTAIVENLGFMVIQSPDGDHALGTLMANDDVALVITDMVMPKMDGRAFIREIQKKLGLSKLPVIIMSSAVTVKDISDLLEAGARAFVQKPVRASDVREYVKRYLED